MTFNDIKKRVHVQPGQVIWVTFCPGKSGFYPTTLSGSKVFSYHVHQKL